MSGVRAMRALPMRPPLSAAMDVAAPSRLCVTLAILAVVLQLAVSSNLLTLLGIAYNTEGGNPVVKFHPATYLAFLALAVRMFQNGRPLGTLEQLFRAFPWVAVFLAMMAVCIGWVVVNVGVSGVAVYVESYFVAGVLFLVIADMSVAQRRALGWIMLWLFLANAVLAIGETVLRRHLLPLYLAHGQIYNDVDYEFRGLALYDHALTGGMMTEMALFLLVGMNLRPRTAVLFGVPLLIGLISFGGRTSLLVTIVTLLGIGGVHMVRGLMARTLRPGVIVMASVGVAAGALLLFYLVTETSIGVRLAGKMSFNDDSTMTRSVQWLMLGRLNWSELLFGATPAAQVEYIYQLGLVYAFDIVENFWLIALLSMGMVGFAFYLTGFLAFLVDLWRFAPLFGRAIVITTVIVASTSNSLGHKSNVLFVMTAAVVATTGFARDRRALSRQPLAAPGVARNPPRPSSGLPGTGALRPLAVARAEPGAGPVPGLVALRTGASSGAMAPAPMPPTLGGLLRDPTPPDRALRPMRLTAARS